MTSTRVSGGSSSPLVVVSLRLPFEVRREDDGPRFVRSPGGLASALSGVFEQRGGVWVGWPGVERDKDDEWSAADFPGPSGLTCQPVELSAREVSLYYAGFCNRTLWPLFHYFVARTRIDAATWRVYERVNDRFATAAWAAAGDEQVTWVHDYQLMLVPAMLRRRARRRRIGYFLHVPFPAADVLRILPWSRALVRGLLGADLVGFHAPEYTEHFNNAARRLLGCEVDWSSSTILYEGRTVAVQVMPLGVDAERFEEAARTGTDTRKPGVARILGVDRLDYTKGIHERLLAMERLLERHPAYRGRIEFMQVAVPSRERVTEYQELKRQIDETVGRINGKFSDEDWTPIRYIVRSLPQEELAGLYRFADVGLVTPLRDGMNLVAKEFVASQIDERGVLVLSELAGAATELQEALLVNPLDVDNVAETLDRALSMPEDERRARMAALRYRVRSRGLTAWAQTFVEQCEKAARRPASRSAVDQVVRQLEGWLSDRRQVGLFLDYDGTLAPIAPRPEDAVLPDATREALRQVVQSNFVDIAIVSGRSVEDVRRAVGIQEIVYAGAHGLEITGPGISFRHEGAERFARAVERAALDLEELAVPGSLVERKGATVAYHVRNVDESLRGKALDDAEAILRRQKLKVLGGKMVLEGGPQVEWHKGQAVLYVLHHRHGVDWPSRVRALYLGDDRTDEDAFRSLHGIGRSILVSDEGHTGASAADFLLNTSDEVAQLLRWLASGGWRAADR